MTKQFCFLFLALTCLAPFAGARGRIEDAPETRIYFDHYRRHQAVTDDGIRIQLIELLDANDRPLPGKPELAVHGFSSNFNTYFELAQLERAKGRRVFLPNFRGHGQGETRSVGVDGANPERDERMTFERLATSDVPAILDFVYRLTGQKVDWVGHSMGGMMMHLALAGLAYDENGKLVISPERQKFIEERLSSFTAIGSPVEFEPMNFVLSTLLGLAPPVDMDLDRSNATSIERAFRHSLRDAAYVAGQLPWSLMSGVMDVRNLTRHEFEVYSEYGGSHVPAPLVESVNFPIKRHGYKSSTGEIDFAKLSMESSSHSTVPRLIISADRDALAPLKHQKQMVANRGFDHAIIRNSGHIDLTFGRHVSEVSEVLDRRSGAPSCRSIFGH